MKTIKTLTTILLLAVSASAFADNNKANSTDPAKGIVVLAPEYVWGSPEDIDASAITENNFTVEAPDMVWGDPADTNYPTFTIATPEMVWSNSDEIVTPLDFPSIVWGDPEDLNF